MSRITAIEPLSGRKPASFVYLDDEPLMQVGRTSLTRLQLQTGQEHDRQTLLSALTAAELTRARELCLRWLGVRNRSRQELAQRLAQQGVEAEVAEQVLTRLETVSLIDDDAFSRAYVRSRLQSGGRSRRVLRAELSRHGIDRTLAEQVTTEELPSDESETCEALAQKQLRHYQRLEPKIARRRLAGFLSRRGFSSEDVFRAVDKVLPESN